MIGILSLDFAASLVTWRACWRWLRRPRLRLLCTSAIHRRHYDPWTMLMETVLIMMMVTLVAVIVVRIQCLGLLSGRR